MARPLIDGVAHEVKFAIRYRGVTGALDTPVGRAPGARDAYASSGVSGWTTFLEWAYESTGVRIRAGANSNLIEGGKVVVRTIHCTAEL